MHKSGKRLICCLLLAILAGCGDQHHPGETQQRILTLFVAASLTDVIQEVGQHFEAAESVQLVYNFASSGALAQQLLASTRGDIFMSANEAWMDRVANGGRILEESRRSLFSNTLVIIADRSAPFELECCRDLARLPFRYLSIGDPDYVPVGRYAAQWMHSVSMETGTTLWVELQGRLAPAPDARSTLAQVKGNRDMVGIVYHTDYLPWADQLKLLGTIPSNAYSRIHYPAAIIASTGEREAARRFLTFLEQPEIRVIFERYGFSVLPDNQEGSM